MTSSLLGGPGLSALLEISQNGGKKKNQPDISTLCKHSFPAILVSFCSGWVCFFCCTVRLQDLSRPGIKPGQWKGRVLISGLSGNPQVSCYKYLRAGKGNEGIGFVSFLPLNASECLAGTNQNGHSENTR